MLLYYKSKARGDMFEETVMTNQFCENKESNNDAIESNTIN